MGVLLAMLHSLALWHFSVGEKWPFQPILWYISFSLCIMSFAEKEKLLVNIARGHTLAGVLVSQRTLIKT